MREHKGEAKKNLGALDSGNSQQIRGGKEMTTLGQNIQTGPITTDQISGINSENKRGIEMFKTEKQNWFSRNFGNIVPVKLLVGLAAGAMLITAIGMPGSGVSADEPARPLGSGYQGFGSLADVVAPAKVERQGLGSIDDWANSGKVTHRAVYSYSLDFVAEPGMTRVAIRQTTGFDPIDVVFLAAMNERGSSKAVPLLVKLETQGFGSLADVVKTVGLH